MHCLLSLFFLFFLSSNLFAQEFSLDTIDLDREIYNSDGEFKSISVKSNVTGMKNYTKVKHGNWKYFDDYGTLVLEEKFTVSKRLQTHILHGNQIFYDPISQDTVLLLNYKNGFLQKVQPFNPINIVYQKNLFQIVKMPNGKYSFNTTNLMIKNDMVIDRVAFYQKKIQLLLVDDSYKDFEKENGDEVFLKNPSFDVYHSGNLVLNPDMESSNSKVSVISMNDKVIDHWAVASISPDFYINKDIASSGEKFLGFRVFSMTNDFEYLRSSISEPLEKDSFYCFSAKLRLSAESKYASNAFGVMFSDKPIFFSTDEKLMVKPDLELGKRVMLYKSKWMTLETVYQAKGNEKFMVFGSFKDHRRITLFEVPGHKKESYYFIDNVSLVKVSHPNMCLDNFLEQTILAADTIFPLIDKYSNMKVGDKFILDNINFEHDRDGLLPTSIETLSALLLVLEKYPTICIELSGHTSSLGKKEYNQTLSQKRAEAVVNYLLAQGISENRLKAVGFGDQYLIADDKTEEGQLINRRVEFKVLSM